MAASYAWAEEHRIFLICRIVGIDDRFDCGVIAFGKESVGENRAFGILISPLYQVSSMPIV